MPFTRFGVMLGTRRYTSQQIISLSVQAEKLGYEAVWLAESYYARSAMPLAAITWRALSG